MSPDSPVEENRGEDAAIRLFNDRRHLLPIQVRTQADIIYAGLRRRGLGDFAEGFLRMAYLISQSRMTATQELPNAEIPSG
jgi:hypothetical protein